MQGDTTVLLDELKALVFVDHPDKVVPDELSEEQYARGVHIGAESRLPLLRSPALERTVSPRGKPLQPQRAGARHYSLLPPQRSAGGRREHSEIVLALCGRATEPCQHRRCQQCRRCASVHPCGHATPLMVQIAPSVGVCGYKGLSSDIGHSASTSRAKAATLGQKVSHNATKRKSHRQRAWAGSFKGSPSLPAVRFGVVSEVAGSQRSACWCSANRPLTCFAPSGPPAWFDS